MEPMIKCDSGKKNFLLKTWKRCQSLPPIRSSRGGVLRFAKMKSWSGRENTKQRAAPEGFMPVSVGSDKQICIVKLHYTNHPLFAALIDVDADLEIGYDFEGPIWLPCDVNVFYKVLAEIESEEVKESGWSGFEFGSCSPFNPSRRLKNNVATEMVKSGFGSYGRLTH